MHIWVDADACPVVIKEILFRAATRSLITTTFVANKLLRVPPSPYLRAMQVDKGFDVADNAIVAALVAGDLVITADIPLAAQVIDKGGHALNPRGEFYSTENIKERLAMRDFMESLRASGVETQGPSAMQSSDRHTFASQLDQFLARQKRKGASVNIDSSQP
ncbi:MULTISPECIES: YaiI/YqxD family protein [unclassified Methylophilus]|uniref:YaiI/YqxD family protein n=1 Tax=unclassified Methylophilus TaxID=2630143 RepID=UPI0003702D6E|nr:MULTISPECIES: YaiI/YqxD family protein [unclassified Methylophilus]